MKGNIINSLLTIFVISMFVLTAFGISNAGDKNIAVVYKVIGNVMIQKAGTTGWIKSEKGVMLDSNDKVRVEKGGYLILKFMDGSNILKVTENTEFKIEGTKEPTGITKSVEMQAGSIYSSITKTKGSFQVVTPTSVASVKGTEFLTIVDDEGNTIVITFNGVVELKNKISNLLQNIEAGNKGTSKTNGSLNVNKSDANDFNKGKLFQDNRKEQIIEVEFQNANKLKKILRITVE